MKFLLALMLAATSLIAPAYALTDQTSPLRYLRGAEPAGPIRTRRPASMMVRRRPAS